MAPGKSAQARRRHQRKKSSTTTSESSELSSAATTPRTSIASSVSAPLTPKQSQDHSLQARQDKGISQSRHVEGEDKPPDHRRKSATWTWTCHRRLMRWISSYRICRWLSLAIPAFFRGLWQITFESKILSLILVVSVYFAFWTAVEGLFRMFKGVDAQSLDANCSVVYVTMPGPIVTVSLIGASPTDPARGTYYYSVINGTTQWQNSIEPPTSLISLLPSKTAISIPLSSPLPPLSGPPSISFPPPAPTTSRMNTISTLPAGSSTFLSTGIPVPSLVTTNVPDMPPPLLPSSSTAGMPTSIASPITFTSVITGSMGEPISTLTLTSQSGEPLPIPGGPSRPFPIAPTSSDLTTSVAVGSSTFLFPPPGASPSPSRSLTTLTGPPIMTSSVESRTQMSGTLTTVLSITVSRPVPPAQSSLPSPSLPVTSLMSSRLESSIRSTMRPLPPFSSLPGETTPVVSFTVSLPRPSSGMGHPPTPSGPVSESLPGFSLATSSFPQLTSHLSTSRLLSSPGSLPSNSRSSNLPGVSSTPNDPLSSISQSPPLNSATSTTGDDRMTIETSTPQSLEPSASGSTADISWSTQRLTSASKSMSTNLSLSSSFNTMTSVTRRPSTDSSAASSSAPSTGSESTYSLSSSLSFLSTMSSSRNTLPVVSSGVVPSGSISSRRLPSASGSPTSSSPSDASPTSSAPTSGIASSSSRSTSSISVTSPTSSNRATNPAGSLTTLRSTTISSVVQSTMPVSVTTVTFMPPAFTSSRFLNTTTAPSTSTFSFNVSSTTSSSGDSTDSTLFASSPSASTTDTIPSSQAPGRPSSGWNLTMTSMRSCSSTGSNCESSTSKFDDGMVTRVIAHGNAKFTFAFPSPDITTTVSYWTGTYPSITGSEPLPLPSYTRTLEQTLGVELPSVELAKRELTSSSTLMATVISAPGTRPTDVDFEAAAVTCGESGNFTLDFDDNTIGPGDGNVLPVAGMKNPYHHLFYSNGFASVADDWEPYPAVSQPNVAIFLPVSGLLPNSPFAGTLLPGELGAGPRASVDAYWFHAYSGFFGCALNGITRCTLQITGYRYDAALKAEVAAVKQNVTIPACYGYIKCRLMEVIFTDDFRGLSGIQFQAYTYNLGIPQIFMMDGLQMEWYNNTCGAGILRIGHR